MHDEQKKTDLEPMRGILWGVVFSLPLWITIIFLWVTVILLWPVGW